MRRGALILSIPYQFSILILIAAFLNVLHKQPICSHTPIPHNRHHRTIWACPHLHLTLYGSRSGFVADRAKQCAYLKVFPQPAAVNLLRGELRELLRLCLLAPASKRTVKFRWEGRRSSASKTLTYLLSSFRCVSLIHLLFFHSSILLLCFSFTATNKKFSSPSIYRSSTRCVFIF